MKTNPSHPVQMAHETIDIDVAYDLFIQNFEKILGRFDPEVTATFAHDPQGADEAIRKMEGEQNLMIFSSQDHGHLLLLVGEGKKAMRYILGNPRVAMQMTQHDIRAALYVPLSVLFYEVGENAIRAEFDRPSSLLGQFNNQRITEVAIDLDAKVAKSIEKAAEQSQSGLRTS